MSDAVAIVGIIAAAASGILAAGIAAWITYKVTNRQLQHDREEARRGRLIETRKGILLGLREALSDSYSYCLNGRLNVQLIQIGKEEGIPTEHFMREISHDPRNPLTTLKEQISPLIGQIPDCTLLDLAIPYYRLLLDLSGQIAQTVQTGSDPAQILDNEFMGPVTKAMLAFNRRIEELLSGEPLRHP
jgi:hypothetical protein